MSIKSTSFNVEYIKIDQEIVKWRRLYNKYQKNKTNNENSINKTTFNQLNLPIIFKISIYMCIHVFSDRFCAFSDYTTCLKE